MVQSGDRAIRSHDFNFVPLYVKRRFWVLMILVKDIPDCLYFPENHDVAAASAGQARNRGSAVDAHHEARHRRAGAADIQRREAPRALDLHLARLPRDLPGGIEQHARAGRPDRMTASDETAARVDRQPAATLDQAALDGLPRLPRRRDAEVIQRHVLGHREAVVRLDAVQLPDALDAGAFPSRLAMVAVFTGDENVVTAVHVPAAIEVAPS